MKRNIQFLFLDIDETLLTKSNAPKEDMPRLLSFLATHGIRYSFSTGRGMYFVDDLLKKNATLLDEFFVVYDGALIVNPSQGIVLHASPIAEKTVQELLHQPFAPKLFFNGRDAIFSIKNVLEPDSSLFKFWCSLPTTDDFYQLYGRDLSEVEKNLLANFCAGHKLDYYSFPYRKNPTHYSVLGVNKGNTKGTAIRRITEHFDIPIANVMIVGDGINDLAAFELGAVNVATTDAISKLKSLASYVLKPNESIFEFLSSFLASNAS